MATDDFFRARLDQMIDMRHPLAVLATRMPWPQIEASLAPLFAHRARPGRVLADADLFGSTAELVGSGVSNAGRPRLPIRLMASLLAEIMQREGHSARVQAGFVEIAKEQP